MRTVAPDLGVGALPEDQQCVGEVFGLDAVRRVEVVAIRERLNREIGEDRGQPVGHPAVE
jgi:hypothetical protein